MSQSVAFINPKVSTKNVGDFFIESSVKRIVSYEPSTSFDIDPRKPITDEDIDKINSCDFAVIVGTNLWYPHIEKQNRWMITPEALKKIKVPFIPLGVGTTIHRNQEAKFDKESKYLIELIHDRCTEASVRDPATYDMVVNAGIKNVRMTGCPTLYRNLKANWELNKKNTDKVVLTVRKGQDKNVNVILQELIRNNKSVTIAAQKKQDLFCARRRFPFLTSPPEALYEFNLDSYEKLVEESYGAIGWRLHGNMLHLAAGNQVAFFANCSRVKSFCETFSLPYIYAEDGEKINKTQLIDTVDRFLNEDIYDDFKIQYSNYRNEMVKFLDKNLIKHNLEK